MILALLLAPSIASAQPACLPHAQMVDLLAGRYSEQQISAGLETGGRLIEIFTTTDGETWTLVMTTPNGVACVVAAGIEWQKAAKPKGNGT